MEESIALNTFWKTLLLVVDAAMVQVGLMASNQLKNAALNVQRYVFASFSFGIALALDVISWHVF